MSTPLTGCKTGLDSDACDCVECLYKWPRFVFEAKPSRGKSEAEAERARAATHPAFVDINAEMLSCLKGT